MTEVVEEPPDSSREHDAAVASQGEDVPAPPQSSPAAPSARIALRMLWQAWSTRSKVIVGSAVAVAVIVGVLLVAGVFGQGQMTVHGTMQVAGNVLDSSQNYPDISDGTQVLVLDPSGKVIATGKLSFDAKATRIFAKLGAFGAETVYDFTVTVPTGESRYGIEVSHRGTIWFTPQQMQKGPGLSLG